MSAEAPLSGKNTVTDVAVAATLLGASASFMAAAQWGRGEGSMPFSLFLSTSKKWKITYAGVYKGTSGLYEAARYRLPLPIRTHKHPFLLPSNDELCASLSISVCGGGGGGDSPGHCCLFVFFFFSNSLFFFRFHEHTGNYPRASFEHCVCVCVCVTVFLNLAGRGRR